MVPPPNEEMDYVLPSTKSQIQVLARYPELRRLYLAHLARFGSFTGAASYIRMRHETVDYFARTHPWFHKQMLDARNAHKDLIEQTIHRRAIDGWDEPKFGKSGIVGHVRRFSDQLLLAYARRHVPEYRESEVIRTSVQGEVIHKHKVEAKVLTPEQRAALRLLMGDEEEEAIEEPEVIKKITVEPSTNGHHPQNGTNGTNGTPHA